MNHIEKNPSTEIDFPYVPNKNLISHMTITNVHSTRIAFKIRTNSRNNYLVKPNNGFLNQGEKISINLQMQPMNNFDKSLIENDKFQILTIPADNTSISIQDIWKDKSDPNIQQSKLRVKLSNADGEMSGSDQQMQQQGDNSQNQQQFHSIVNPPNNQSQYNQQQLQQQTPAFQHEQEKLKSHSMHHQMAESIVLEKQTAMPNQTLKTTIVQQSTSIDYKKKIEEMNLKVGEQESLLSKLTEERNKYLKEISQYKNVQTQQNENQGFQITHVIIVGIISLIIGALLSNK